MRGRIIQIEQIVRSQAQLSTKVNAFRDSLLLNSVEAKDFVLSLIPGQLRPSSIITLIYRGSRDGWKVKNFHDKCDGKGANIVLMKSKAGKIFGGYTSVGWQSIGNYVKDEQAFIFSVDKNKRFACKKPEFAIYRRADIGPYFGANELGVAGEILNQPNKGFCKKGEQYNLPTTPTEYNKIVGEGGTEPKGTFTCEEIEVY